MKKVLSYVVIFNVLFLNLSFFTFQTAKASTPVCFTITAYYSPIENQEYYAHWDIIKEKRMNWQWVAWSGWKPVFAWMIAAPLSKYPLGTKIYIEWVWVGEVADKWSAIVEAWERWYDCDRLDIWMWYWDEWLKKAWTWWKPTVTWYIVDNTTPTSINLNNFKIKNSVTKNFTKNPNYNPIFSKNIWQNSDIKDIEQLHIFLYQLGYYKWNIKTKYNKETVKAIYNFQLDNKIVNSPKNNWAWVWQDETRVLAFQINNTNIIAKNNTPVIWDSNIISNNNVVENDTLKILSNQIQISPDNAKESDVKKIQNIFAEMWLYKGKIDGKYESIKDTLISYQVNKWIISSKNSSEAGYFWGKTTTQLNKDYALVLEKNWDKIEQTKKIEAQLASIKKSVDSRVETHISSIWTPKVWDVGENVRNLQKTLKTLWYFKVADTAIFWETTKNSLIKYQMDKWIIKSKEEDGAWLFWPKTKESLKSELAIILETQLLKEKDLLSYKK